MIDKISMTSTRIPYMNAQSQSSLATGLAHQPKQASLRTQLLEQADKVFTPDRVQTSFPGRMVDALNSVADAQNQAARITRDYELGREQDLSKVMINQQVSSLGFQLTLNIRNKVMTAYKDIMNMPV
tara:strand:- start:174 stop:554 length:381 start_codon:yes stop_codon:yes gene_type:complete